jgi:hypothetical protein
MQQQSNVQQNVMYDVNKLSLENNMLLEVMIVRKNRVWFYLNASGAFFII